MKQQLQFITIGAENLDSLKEFYVNSFGWKPSRDDGGIVFFQMNGFILSLYSAEELAEDIGIHNNGNGFKRITTAICFNSEQEVDAVFRELRDKGAEVVKEPQKVFWGGYSGYVSDPEGNYWELAYNPFLQMDAEGNVLGG